MSSAIKKAVLRFQRDEITMHHVYSNLARIAKGENAAILRRIAAEEVKHYSIFKAYTGRNAGPDMIKVWMFVLMARFFSITFAVKLMERMAEHSIAGYAKYRGKVERISAVIAVKKGQMKEMALIARLGEEKLKYISSMVLGVNDAIIEITGAVSGITFALQNASAIAASGFIMGIAAALSMAASEYMSQDSEGADNPLKASLYTGVVYLITVTLIVAPFFVFRDYMAAFWCMLAAVAVIIAIFTFFVSVVTEKRYLRVFLKMALICTGVVIITFLIGILANKLLGIKIT